jgi:hypothetical protein
MMFKCNLCNKEFNSLSKLERHKNNKLPCNKVKDELLCKYCNINFVRLSHKKNHEKTNKHIVLVKKLNEELYDCKIIDSYQDLKNKYNELKINYELFENKYQELKIKYELLDKNNIELTNNYNILLNENKLLKENANKNLDHHEQIYIIHERTFVELNANIYKIGKTKNIKNRLNGYSKGSKLLFSIACKDCIESENKILNYLKSNEKYIHTKEYGNEYFQCNLKDLISDIYNLIID